MAFSEINTISDLKKTIAQGEGIHIEFKHKISDPVKVITEMIAFANTEGGHLIVGVDDNKSLVGLKFPEEDKYELNKIIQRQCKPSLPHNVKMISVSEKKSILVYTIPARRKRPHFLIQDDKKRCFVRSDHMTVQASREMKEIIRRSKTKKNIGFSWGDSELLLMRYLDEHSVISLKELQRITGLKKAIISKKLILLVLTNVLKITPTEKEDVYSRVP